MAGPTAEESANIRSYIIGQAAKLTLPQLVEKVKGDSAQVLDAARAVPAGRFAERPGQREWAAAHVLAHVLKMSRDGTAAITGILADGTRPPNPDDRMTDELPPEVGDAERFWAAFEASRAPLYAAVLAAKGDEHPEIKIAHPWFGELTWREWFLFMRVHDLDHMRQLQQIAAAFAA